jgi:hypothetical protein
MALDAARTLRGALAGAVAAGAWAAQQPVDKRVFGYAFDDVELLGKAITTGPAWRPIGLALHLQNGALFGAAYANLAPLVPLPGAVRGPLAGLIEHVASFPLAQLTDRFHPARAELPKLTGEPRAFWQATWRHLLFGFVLGELERRLNDQPPPPMVSFEAAGSTNGHGSLEDAVLARPSTS